MRKAIHEKKYRYRNQFREKRKKQKKTINQFERGDVLSLLIDKENND
jgi:hypothetical protein